MKIVLVRHGQTPANRLKALDTARPGLPLSAEGLEQAERLAVRWEDEVAAAPSIVAVSPLTRTRQTAAPLCAKYAILPVIRDGIRELRSGDVEMNPDSVSDSTYVRGTLSWAHGRIDTRMHGGESGREVLARALPVVREVCDAVARIGGVGVLVMHGAIIRFVTTALADNVPGELVSAHFMNNAGTVVLEWPGRFAPSSNDDLIHAFHALTWNDRPVGEWDLDQLSASAMIGEISKGNPRYRM